ncbi:MAG TPA: ABC transporter permease [Gammaproteobacteria bacterium]|nr:ABC transporter permease [Gammaproteobacteria bacterium]
MSARAVADSTTVSRSRLVARRFLRQRLALLGLAFVLLLFGLAYLSPYFTAWQYDQLDTAAFLSPPSARHWFGTTQNGFDMFALTMRGLQKSLVIGLLGALISTGLAAVVGAFAGYFGGWLNTALVALIDLLLVLPAFLIIAILSPTFHGQTWLVFVLLLAAFQWMITARIVRGMTLSLKEREFVQAARFMGVPGPRIIFRHILPNMASLLIIDATVNVSSLILAEVGLSFFGFGVQPPDVSLGTLIGDYSGSALTFPWQFYFPAGFLVALVLAINVIGDGLRDAFDPNAGGEPS